MDSICHYEIYPNYTNVKNVNREILHTYIQDYIALVNHLLNGEKYIFFNEPFNLEPKFGEGPPKLVGKTNCGACIDDGWFIVRILNFITKCFEGTKARVWDEDGYFTLFEVADVLPKWIDPETSENRIWIYKGQQHILSGNKEKDQVLPLVDALEMLQSEFIPTAATSNIQKLIEQRIESTLSDHFHNANVQLPAKLGFILQKYPNLIAVVVQAMISRTAEDIPVISNPFVYFPPTTNVMCSVKFNRIQYAAMSQDRFVSPRGNGFKTDGKKSDYLIGMKMAMGAEIVCHYLQDKGEVKRDTSKTFLHFYERLVEYSYFADEIKSSEKWKLNYNRAKEFYNSSIEFYKHDSRMNLLFEQARNLECKYEHMKGVELIKEDGVEWMTIDDKKLLATFKSFNQDSLNQNGNASSISNFIDGQSDYDGINMENVDTEKHRRDFDEIANEIKDILELSDYNNESSSTDMDDLYDEDVEDAQMKGLMESMDAELRSTTMADSFVTDVNSPPPATNGAQSTPDSNGDNKVVNLEKNLSEQLSASLLMQAGTAGPVSTLLGTIKD